VTTHLVTDLDTLDKFVGETLSRFLVAMLTLVGTAAILMWMHWQLALLILLFNPLVIYATVQLGKRVKHLKKLENDSTSRFTQALTETLDAIQEVRAGNRQGFFLGRLGLRARKCVTTRWIRSGKPMPVAAPAAAVPVRHRHLPRGGDAHRAVFRPVHRPDARGVQLPVVHDRPGGATAQPAIRLLRRGRRAEPDQRTAGACRRAAVPGGSDPFAGRETVGIEVRDLRFAYGDEPVLDQMNLSIAPGEKVAIVGASGGGKSTLVQLLLGLYTPRPAPSAFGGASQQEIGLETLRENVAVVLQHPALFNDTVRANLTMGRDCSDEACWQALRIAQLDATIAPCPGPGQCGRAFRRALVRRPAPAPGDCAHGAGRAQGGDPRRGHLGAGCRHRVQPAPGLARFLSGRTTLIIAHRLSAVKQADRVLVFDGGHVAEDGDHQQLIAEGGCTPSCMGICSRAEFRHVVGLAMQITMQALPQWQMAYAVLVWVDLRLICSVTGTP
jgi:ATP-binding cassette subfamily C protein